MRDYYGLLGVERKLTLGEAELEAAFRKASKEVHPDAGGSQSDFEQIQEARQALASPAVRLRHWLEAGGYEGDLRGSVSAELGDLFGKLGDLFQRTDSLIREREQAQSALARAMLEGRVHTIRDEMEATGEELATLVEDREKRFPDIEAGMADGWQVARDLAFLSKWQAQVRERFGALW